MSIYQLESNETVLYKGTMLDFRRKKNITLLVQLSRTN